MTNNTLREIAQTLTAAQSILIFAHKNPDGDAIGSAVCAGLMLKSLGKDVDYALQEDLKGIAAIFDELKDPCASFKQHYDIGLVVDTSTPDYIYNSELLGRCAKILLIDHHLSNDGFGDLHFVEPDSAAAGELIYALSGELGVSLTPDMARALYVSLSEDTGNFTYSNTTSRTHRIVSELYTIADDYYLIKDRIKMYDASRLLLMKAVLDNTEYYHHNRLIIASLLIDNGILDYLGQEVDTEGIIDIIRKVKECRLAVFIKQKDAETFKISMRSNDSAIDVAEFAKRFGGGGHIKAAGFDFKGTHEALTKIFVDYAGSLWTDL